MVDQPGKTVQNTESNAPTPQQHLRRSGLLLSDLQSLVKRAWSKNENKHDNKELELVFWDWVPLTINQDICDTHSAVIYFSIAHKLAHTIYGS